MKRRVQTEIRMPQLSEEALTLPHGTRVACILFDDTQFPDIAAALRRIGTVFDSCSSFEEEVSGWDGLVCLITSPPPPSEQIGHLVRLMSATPVLPSIGVAPLQPHAARLAAELPFVHVVWVSEGPRLLLDRIRQAVLPNPTTFLEAVRQSVQVNNTGLLRSALLKLCDRRLPAVFSVEELSRLVGASGTTVRGVWQQGFREAAPKKVIDWFLLVRGLEKACQGWRRKEIARHLRIHPTTLDRISLRLTGRTFVLNAARPGLRETMEEARGWWRREASEDSGR